MGLFNSALKQKLASWRVSIIVSKPSNTGCLLGGSRWRKPQRSAHPCLEALIEALNERGVEEANRAVEVVLGSLGGDRQGKSHPQGAARGIECTGWSPVRANGRSEGA